VQTIIENVAESFREDERKDEVFVLRGTAQSLVLS